VPAGRKIRPAPGRFGHQVRRHYDRCAGCIAGSGNGAGGGNSTAYRRLRPRSLARAAPWGWKIDGPGGRAVVGRRKAGGLRYSPQPHRQMRWLDTAPFGVPLPFLCSDEKGRDGKENTGRMANREWRIGGKRTLPHSLLTIRNSRSRQLGRRNEPRERTSVLV
jgi:hypothetical protein